MQGASTADGGKVVQYADWGGANQQWQLVRVGSGGGSLPSTFRWSSSGVLAGPKPDAQHPLALALALALAIKDFSIVRHNNQWLTYATTASPSGWGLVQFNFADWSQAASAPHTYLDTASAVGPGYGPRPRCSTSRRRTCGTWSTRPVR